MINWLLGIIKYPVAIVMALLTWELIGILWEMILAIKAEQEIADYFFMGMALYILVWFVLFRQRFGRMLMILEHEFIHALFSLLTFNRVVEIRANIVRGHILHLSGGNWLMTIAPYFFSLSGVVIIFLLQIASPQYYPILVGALGYVLTHHLHTLTVMLSPHQSDIKEVGYLFSILFLPSANLLMVIALLSQLPYDGIEFTEILEHLYALLIYYWETFKLYISNWL